MCRGDRIHAWTIRSIDRIHGEANNFSVRMTDIGYDNLPSNKKPARYMLQVMAAILVEDGNRAAGVAEVRANFNFRNTSVSKTSRLSNTVAFVPYDANTSAMPTAACIFEVDAPQFAQDIEIGVYEAGTDNLVPTTTELFLQLNLKPVYDNMDTN